MRILLILLIVPLFTLGQDKNTVDSLATIYRGAGADSTRILALCEMAKQHYRSNPDTAIALSMEALKWANKINFDKGKARTYNVIGLGHWVKSNHTQALENYQKSLYYFEKSKDRQGFALSLNNIGLIYYYQNEFQVAREYYDRAIRIHQELQHNEGIALALNNIGLSYEGQGDLKLALDYYNQALRIFEKESNKSGIGQSLTNIGYIHYKLDSYPAALTNLQRGAAIQRQIRDRATLISSLLGIAQIYQKQKKYSESVDYAKQALQTAIEVKSTFDVKESLQVLYTTYKEKNDYAIALDYFEQYKKLNDSIFSIANNKAIATLEGKAMLERKQKEIESLERQGVLERRINTLVAAVLVAVCVFAFFIFYNRRKLQQAYNNMEAVNVELRQMKKDVDVKAEMLRRSNHDKDKIFSMVSHDVRSPLNSLRALLELINSHNLSMDELKGLMPDLVKRVNYTSDIVEELLHWSRSQMAALEVRPSTINTQELLAQEVERSAMSAAEKGVSLQVSAPSDFPIYADSDMIKTVLRNLVTNAIKFCKAGDRIVLSARRDLATIRISVRDSGVGIKPEDLPKLFNVHGFTTPGTANEKGTGLGLMLCKELIEQNGGAMGVTSTWGTGADFYFTLPIPK